MRKHIIRREVTSVAPSALTHLHPLLQRIYAVRDVTSDQVLTRELSHLHPYEKLLGIEQAVGILAEALRRQERILIVGDFDADGATSTALAVRALKSFGARHVSYLVPNRFAYGYGLTPELVKAAEAFNPALIVTVDNGIANHAGVAAAKARGIRVIITDHHLPAATLPEADAIVNPNQHGDPFPSKNLAGVGVVFYVMLALRRHLVATQWFEQQHLPEPNMSRLLDLVALGTVADLVPLDHNNRILVHQGLRRIRAGQCVPGIVALLELADRQFMRIVASDLGFAVASRLNAAGRLDDMSLGIECLLSDDPYRAREMARTLNQLNQERKTIEQGMQYQALETLANLNPSASGDMPRGLCLYDESWHQGVIGILAARIKERFNRPVIVFAPGQTGEIKGSARSIPGLHIRDVLALIDVRYPGLIAKFGGHAMAAGLTLSCEALAQFKVVFNEVVSSQVTEAQLQHNVLTDGELRPEEYALEVAAMLRDGGPWGQAFPEPVFDGVFKIMEQRIVGDKHLKLRLALGDKLLDAIAFFVNTDEWPNHRCERVRVVYRLDINEFRGRQSVQLMVDYLEPVT